MRASAAHRLRLLAGAIWTRAKLGDVRYFSEMDHAMVRVVAHIDNLANRLDPPW